MQCTWKYCSDQLIRRPERLPFLSGMQKTKRTQQQIQTVGQTSLTPWLHDPADKIILQWSLWVGMLCEVSGKPWHENYSGFLEQHYTLWIRELLSFLEVVPTVLLGPNRDLTPDSPNDYETQSDPSELTVTRTTKSKASWAQQQFTVHNKQCIWDPVRAGPEYTGTFYD